VSAHAADPDAIACPRCGRPVGGDQAWCLNCGAAARTRLVPAPGWRAPLAILATLGALAVAGLTWGFLALTDDSGDAGGTTGTTQQTAPATTPAP
jgi:hypothetical protein